MREYSRLTSYQSKKFEDNKKQKKFILIILGVLAIFLGIFILSKISYWQTFRITKIKVSGARESIAKEIENRFSDILVNSYLGIFAKSNSLIYPRKNLLSSVGDISQVQSLTIERDGFKSIKVNVLEKNPSAIVCPTLPDLDLDYVDCYFVDWSGRIFDQANNSSSTLNIYFIPTLGENQSLMMKYVKEQSEFMDLQNFYNKVRLANLDPKYILINEEGEYEMYANDVIIYFFNHRPFAEQLENLILFWNHNLDKKYEYIDIRYGSNVFYHLKNN